MGHRVGEYTIDRAKLHVLCEFVANAASGSPVHRVNANWVIGSLAHTLGDLTAAVHHLDTAVGLLPSAAPRESGWFDREHRLGEHPGLVADAIAAHCAIDDPVGAIEVAELGRGILLAAQLDFRADLTDLERAHPDLASQFRQLRALLNTPDTTDQDLHAARIHDSRWDTYDKLILQIRECPGFARFFLPPSLSDLRHAAEGGAVILVNAAQRRSDAIIITATGDPVSVELPRLTFTDVVSQATDLLDATHDATPIVGSLRRQRVLPEHLKWLWEAVIKPILDALPIATHTHEPAPRVWWMATGLLSLFPLHAAGHPGKPGALDAVISSYTPTLRALANTRALPPVTVHRQLTVALEHTLDSPGLPDLAGAATEAIELHLRHPETTPLTEQDATVERVLTALPNATWAHFACHATADLTAPSRGGLYLFDGLLPVIRISQLHLTHAELAYLSACSTAFSGWQHADESIHLATAFQLAGFKHVIASLWPLDDEVAATAAKGFYNCLPASPTADHAAEALHRVTVDLRERNFSRPDLWASLIHSGP